MRGLNIGKFQIIVMVIIGFIISNIATPLWKISTGIVFAIGMFLLLGPRVPGWLRQIGVGILLGSSTVQDFVVTQVESLLGITPDEEVLPLEV